MTAYRISIDSGTEFGYAVWDEEQWKRDGTPALPCKTGVIGPRLQGKWLARLAQGMRLFEVALTEQWDGLKRAYVEYPTFFDTAGGHTSARRGDLVKLCIATGWICGVLDHHRVPIQLVRPVQWKGQLPKPVVNARIREIYGLSPQAGWKSHDWDAVGIGLWAQGAF